MKRLTILRLDNKVYTWLQIILLFVLPVILLLFDVVPYDAHLLFGGIILCLIVGIVLKERWTLSDLGLQLRFKREAWLVHIAVTIVGVGVIVFLARMLHLPSADISAQGFYHFNPIFLIALNFAQEFLYRVFLIRKLELVLSRMTLVVIANAFIFAFMHLIFTPPWFMFGVTLIMGAVYAILYIRYRSWILVGLSHTVLNALAIYLCFVRDVPGCAS